LPFCHGGPFYARSLPEALGTSADFWMRLDRGPHLPARPAIPDIVAGFQAANPSANTPTQKSRARIAAIWSTGTPRSNDSPVPE